MAVRNHTNYEGTPLQIRYFKRIMTIRHSDIIDGVENAQIFLPMPLSWWSVPNHKRADAMQSAPVPRRLVLNFRPFKSFNNRRQNQLSTWQIRNLCRLKAATACHACMNRFRRWPLNQAAIACLLAKGREKPSILDQRQRTMVAEQPMSAWFDAL